MTLLALQGVTKGYGEGASRTPVLHDINLEIARENLSPWSAFPAAARPR